MPPAPRVMVVCDRLDLAGGVERFACALADHLAAQGLPVALASVATRRDQIHYPLSPVVRVLQGDADALPSAPLLGAALARRRALLRQQWHSGRVLARLTRDERPDVLVLNGLTTACSLLAVAPVLAPRAICCDHNHYAARSRPWRWLRALLYRRAAALVSLTEADRPRYAALNPRTEVIANASALSAAAPVGVAEPVALAVGRHVAQKGLDLLLTAWPAVAACLPAARLHIVGAGPLEADLRRMAHDLGLVDRVTWFPPTADIASHYRRAAVFVLPSRYEGMPLALLEAQALGLPAVAFDCPTGPRDILAADTGMLVPPQDTAALADALVTLLGQPALRSRMGAAAQQRSRLLFSPQRQWDSWTALVQRVAAARALGLTT